MNLLYRNQTHKKKWGALTASEIKIGTPEVLPPAPMKHLTPDLPIALKKPVVIDPVDAITGRALHMNNGLSDFTERKKREYLPGEKLLRQLAKEHKLDKKARTLLDMEEFEASVDKKKDRAPKNPWRHLYDND